MAEKKRNKNFLNKIPLLLKEKPEAPDWLINNIAEASKNAKGIYFLYMGFLAFCSLTVVSTTDRRFILNESTKLPIVGVEVPLLGFFIIAPALVILIFVYFQLYLHRLKGLIEDLRTHYAPIGKRRLYPWMINIAEEPEEGLIGRLQIWIVKFSLWWLTPVVLILISWWFLKKHDPLWSYILVILSFFGILVVYFFKYYYEYISNLKFIILVLITFLFFIFSLIIIPKINKGDFKRFNIDLRFQGLVIEPKYKARYWVDMQDIHLENAYLPAVNLERANLIRASLQKANLWEANLQKVNLRDATLQEAILIRANLQEANLERAKLQEANLWEADLQKANLKDANLQKADLRDAKLCLAKNWVTAQIYMAFWNEKTQWPDDFIRPCKRHLPPERCELFDLLYGRGLLLLAPEGFKQPKKTTSVLSYYN